MDSHKETVSGLATLVFKERLGLVKLDKHMEDVKVYFIITIIVFTITITF